MSTTTTNATELRTILKAQPQPQPQLPPTDTDNENQEHQPDEDPSTPGPEATNVVTAVPDGGYGWVVVTACALLTFWFNGIMASWGVVQAALLRSNLKTTSTSTISFVGTLGLATVVAFGLFGVRVMRLLGARRTALVGVVLLAGAEICSSFTISNVGGLFATSGVLFGSGACLCYALSNTIPTQYFANKLGLASGLIKFGGGLGAAVLSIALDAVIKKVGIAWAFRILGLCILATGMPAAWFIRERDVPIGRAPFLDLSMFKHLPFTAVFCAGAIGTFSLFVPPYFLPLVAQTIGLTSATGAWLVAGFNLCTAIGRLLSGYASDVMGPVNMFLCTMVLNAVSMLAIWPFSDSIGPLVVFAMINGLANGAFFTLFPVVVMSTASKLGSGQSSSRAAVAMSMSITGWTGGYLLGAPIAGYILQAAGVGAGGFSETTKGSNNSTADNKANAEIPSSIDPYRPAIFYAGGVALAAAGFVLIARLKLGQGMKQKV
jgi:MFS family permease